MEKLCFPATSLDLTRFILKFWQKSSHVFIIECLRKKTKRYLKEPVNNDFRKIHVVSLNPRRIAWKFCCFSLVLTIVIIQRAMSSILRRVLFEVSLMSHRKGVQKVFGKLTKIALHRVYLSEFLENVLRLFRWLFWWPPEHLCWQLPFVLRVEEGQLVAFRFCILTSIFS